jgi:amino acid adenylation domain-containing protein
MNSKIEAANRALPDPNIQLFEPRLMPLGSMVSRWAQSTPDATAVSQGDRSWSYAELVASARSLTSSLQPGEVIAVTGEQSFGLVAGILGVLSSRSVLLTIDPHLPERRQKLLVEQAGARRLLAARNMPPWMRQHQWDDVIKVDLDPVIPPGMPSTAPEPLPDDPAYIFFTSGSTGVPKGVRGCHKGLSHFLAWQSAEFNIGPSDRIAQLTSLSFDALLRAIFLPLVNGGVLCLLPPSTTMAADSVLPWLQEAKITLLHTVPSLALTWIAGAPTNCKLPDLRFVFFSGEALHESLVVRWRSKFPSGRVVNLYGPTETTMIKFFYEVPTEPDPGVQAAGWPMPETQGLLLDDQGKLCPAGEMGEIFIRTPFRTLGYTNAPEEQKLRFIRNPFRDDPSDLLYRTGDRGRYRADGALEILGRLDYQIKIQGIRVEPDEVSAAITKHPKVQSCFVAVRQTTSPEPSLVAYVVGPGLSAEELREYLSSELPMAMIPSFFQFLECLPLSPNGKVDRNALPAPATAQSFVAPRTQMELKLAALWLQVLEVKKVGLDDNFFELGGNSLRLAQLHVNVRKLVHFEFPITKLFQHPTVRMLANYLSPQTPKRSGGLTARQRAARQIAARAGQVVIEEE